MDSRKTPLAIKASGFHQKLTSRSFVVFGHFMWDIVIQLSKLSLFLQSRTCSVADVADRLQATISVLQQMRQQYYGYHVTMHHIYFHDSFCIVLKYTFFFIKLIHLRNKGISVAYLVERCRRLSTQMSCVV